MNKNPLIFIISSIVLIMIILILLDTSSFVIINQVGSSIHGCENTNECFIPSTINISMGDEVIWHNIDNAAHTITSGDVTNGPNGIFDSGLVGSNQKFSHVFDKVGVYNYYCMIHPWNIGSVGVHVWIYP